MTDKKRNMLKKENIPEDPSDCDPQGLDNLHIDNHMSYAHPESIDGPYHRFTDLQYNDYQPEGEERFAEENFQTPGQYNFDYQRMYYDQTAMGESSSDTENDKKSKKTGRKKISMEYIQGKNKRSVTFSKRKKGIIKKAYELNVLTGTQILLLVASESGHVYTFATPKLKPIISNHERLIQQCLNAPSSPPERKNVNMGYYGNDDDKKDKYYQGYNEFYGNFENRE